jgi:pilus assembly protein Flp/PilA
MSKFLKLIKNEEGATAIEYGLIAALIAVAAITALTTVGTQLNTTFSSVGSSLTSANG